MAQTHLARKSELLTSWKEIANFLGKGVRTVQRWEATLGLPVIRPAEGGSGIVMARPSDLEAWIRDAQQRARRNGDGRQTNNAEVRAAFTECVRELHRYHMEVRELCDRMNVTREGLRQEIERLKFLCGEWNTIRSHVLGDQDRSASAKAN